MEKRTSSEQHQAARWRPALGTGYEHEFFETDGYERCRDGIERVRCRRIPDGLLRHFLPHQLFPLLKTTNEKTPMPTKKTPFRSFAIAESQDLWALFPIESLREVKDYHQRVEEGEPAPAGEDPISGALAHRIDRKLPPAFGAILAEVKAVNASGDILRGGRSFFHSFSRPASAMTPHRTNHGPKIPEMAIIERRIDRDNASSAGKKTTLRYDALLNLDRTAANVTTVEEPPEPSAPDE